MVTPVLANTGSANRDPAVFDDPERLDITREDPTAMLIFGGGVYYGLGAHLARIELTEALRVITQRMPNPRLPKPAPWKGLTAGAPFFRILRGLRKMCEVSEAGGAALDAATGNREAHTASD